jgi:DNA repair ATPase RecN
MKKREQSADEAAKKRILELVEKVKKAGSDDRKKYEHLLVEAIKNRTMEHLELAKKAGFGDELEDELLKLCPKHQEMLKEIEQEEQRLERAKQRVKRMAELGRKMLSGGKLTPEESAEYDKLIGL